MEKSEILKGLEHAPYDFIACNYWKLSKEELKDILLEVLALLDDDTYNEVKKGIRTSLIEFRWDEE